VKSLAIVPWYSSISTRLLAGTALLISLIVGAGLWQWSASSQRLIRDQAREQGQAIAQALSLSLTPLVADENWNQARIVVDLLVQRNADFVYVLIYDQRSPDVALALPPDQEQRSIPDLVPLAVSQRAVQEGEPRFADTFLLHDVAIAGRKALRGERIIEVAQDLRLTTGRYGVLRLGISLGRVEAMIAATLRSALLAVSGLMLAALIAAWMMARTVTRPVLELATLMDRVGEGDLEKEATVTGNHEVSHLGEAFNDMLAGLRQKRVLEKYVPMGARADIEGDRAGKLELGGHRVRAAILFSDLRGFTSLSERLTPREVVSMLNEYLEMMSGPIHDHKGDINEYVGDAILAVFRCGDDKNGALNAVKAAWQMQARLRTLREKTQNEEVRKLIMGIGIHVGDIIEGNIGSRDRVKYGVVGDTVNLSARIQDRSRDGTLSCIFVSSAAQAELNAEFKAVSLGEMTFKGKKNPVEVFEIAGPQDPSAA